MRKFEKISFEEFKKDIKDDINLYNEYKLPCRNSSSAAGYDFYLIEDLEIKPHEIKKIPTGIKAIFDNDVSLFLIVRSKTGFKYNIRLCNQVGVIDADYYNNDNNEGHMYIAIQNESDETWHFKKGESLVQGVFIKYYLTDDDMGNDVKRKSTY